MKRIRTWWRTFLCEMGACPRAKAGYSCPGLTLNNCGWDNNIKRT